MLVVRLIDAFNLRVCGHSIDHIDVALISSISPGRINHMDSPLPLWKLKSDPVAAIVKPGQIDPFLMKTPALCKWLSND